MKIGRLRHRITLQFKTVTQDPVGTRTTETWLTWLADEPAEVVPLSGREFIQAGGRQAAVSARMTIRWRSGIEPTMRVLFDGTYYNIEAVLPDGTARRWLTLMVIDVEPVEAPAEVDIDGGDSDSVDSGALDGGGA